MGKVICFCIVFLSSTTWSEDKIIIGPTAYMSVSEVGLSYHARIDTGASITSLNAYDFELEGGSAEKMENNVGKMLMFTTENMAGQKQRLKAKIVRTSTAKNALGRETRYVVELHIGDKGHEKKVEVNLRDRSHMDYQLLVGRNWLQNQYIVDVSAKKVIGPIASISILETGMLFNTRIDSGASFTSLHAIDLHVENGVKDMEKNVGKTLSFTTENELGNVKRVHAIIVGTESIRSAQGSDLRYKVELTLGEKGQEYKVKVNLKDRSRMSHKLLIGHDWLQGHYVVDISL